MCSDRSSFMNGEIVIVEAAQLLKVRLLMKKRRPVGKHRGDD